MNKTEKKLDYLQKAYNLPIHYAKKLIKPKFIIKRINVKNIMKNKKKIKTKAVYPSLSEQYGIELDRSYSQYEHELIDVEAMDAQIARDKQILIRIIISVISLALLGIILITFLITK